MNPLSIAEGARKHSGGDEDDARNDLCGAVEPTAASIEKTGSCLPTAPSLEAADEPAVAENRAGGSFRGLAQTGRSAGCRMPETDLDYAAP